MRSTATEPGPESQIGTEHPRCDIAVRPGDEDQQLVSFGHEDLAVLAVDRQRSGAVSMVLDPGTPRTGGSSPLADPLKHEHRLTELLRHDDLVAQVDRTRSRASSAPASSLSLDRAVPRRVLVRQPGEHRNLRVRDSIRDQNLLALRVDPSAPGLPIMSDGADRRAPDRASGATSPSARSGRPWRCELPKFVTHSSPFFRSSEMPVGFASFVFGPLSTRLGATSPRASASNTRIDGPCRWRRRARAVGIEGNTGRPVELRLRSLDLDARGLSLPFADSA